MHYRNIAVATGIQFAFDLRTLPAIAEDELVDAINRGDEMVLIRQTDDADTKAFYQSG